MRDVLAAHDYALTFGGASGVRDIGSIEAAIGRPFTGYYRRISAKAAALAESLARNHGFIDGNKRTTFLIIHVFIQRSDYQLIGLANDQHMELEDLIVDIADRHPNFAAIENWFRARLHKKR